MHCSACSATTHVLDTRSAGDQAIRRRRECTACGKRFTTYERVDVNARVDSLELAVVEFVRGLDPTLEEATPPCPT